MRVDLPENGFATVAYELHNGMYVPEHITASGGPQPEVDHELYLKNFGVINDTYATATDPETGREFEVAAANIDKLQSGNVVIFYSTDFSSLTQNIGNAIELAGMAAANPNTCYIYVAYPGNGRSQNMPKEERRYYKQTGRLTIGTIPEGEDYATPETYKSLPHMEAMQRAVMAHFEVEPEHVSADKSGGRLALGGAAAGPANSIKDGYLNGVPGLASEAKYGQMTELVYQTQSRVSRHDDPEYIPGKVTGKTIAEAKPLMPRIYEADDHKKVLHGTYLRAATGNFVANRGIPLLGGGALKGHDDLQHIQDHAVVNDLMAVLMRHEAMISLQTNVADNPESAQKTIEAIVRVGSFVMNRIHPSLRSPKRGVEFQVMTGRPEAHTDNPSTRLAAERRGLRSIATFMRLIFSSNPEDMIVTYEQPQEEVA